MHQEMVDELLKFARKYNLLLICDFDEEQGFHRFGFQNRERTWMYVRELSQEMLDTFNGPTTYFARNIIETVKRTCPFLKDTL